MLRVRVRLALVAALLLAGHAEQPSTVVAASVEAPPHAAAAPAATLAAQLATKLQTTLDRHRVGLQIPGASAAVIFSDGSQWSGASGRASLDPLRSAKPSTPFVLGSITKTFVAALTVQLAEEGLIGLDDPLSTWLPDYPQSEQITLRQLLNHTSGVFNYFEHSAYNRKVFERPSHHWLPQEILDTFPGDPYFAPGTGYHYSNTNYVLLGMVIERSTGTSLGELLSSRFWEPLGMNATFFQPDGPVPSAAALGYLVRDGEPRQVWDGSGYRPTRSAATVAWAAGGMVGSASDVARWARELYSGAVLSEAGRSELMDYEQSPATKGRYALGTMTRSVDGRRMFGHTGSLRGFSAAMWHVPDADATVVVLTNRGRIKANTVADALMARVLADTVSPSVPSGLTAASADDLGVALAWQASSDDRPGDVSYRIFRDGIRIAITTTTSYVDRPSSAGSYRYKLRAVDAAGNKSAFSDEVVGSAVNGPAAYVRHSTLVAL
ncbi:MAG TPA: serine hydrolase domain-containing protein [Candidatus Caenarcaniphilales bacterium]|nr:serine hydrolase domain-containing protein [Candidatus Caenarcaniphilales bacterium]